MSLRVFNTLTGQKEPFEPLQKDGVRMYVCGVTVYDLCHIGHARSAIVFDTIYRYLKYKGYPVTYVRNFTDIDDKIIKRANEEGIGWQEVTAKYIAAFYEDMDRLNIARPEIEPKATEHIGDMLELIQCLIDNGMALLEHKGNDVHITVRAPYPEGFLHRLTGDVKYLVESFWEGLRCNVMVPCIHPCGKNAPGTGLYEVGKLIDSKRQNYPKYPCPVCSEWQPIDSLLRNAPTAQPLPAYVLDNREILVEMRELRRQIDD